MTTLIYQASGSGKTKQCDAKCYNAKKPKCDCICGGVNHGVGFDKALKNSREFLFGKAGDLFEESAKAPDKQEGKNI